MVVVYDYIFEVVTSKTKSADDSFHYESNNIDVLLNRPCFRVFCLVILWKAILLAKSTSQHGWGRTRVEVSSSEFYRNFTGI